MRERGYPRCMIDLMVTRVQRSAVCGAVAAAVVTSSAMGCAKDSAQSGEGGDDVADSADAGTDSTGDGGECAVEFEGSAPGSFAVWTVTNARAVPIYLPGTRDLCILEPWSVTQDGERIFWHSGSYIPTCELLHSTPGCGYGCSDGPATVVKLNPGASVEQIFGLYGWKETNLPPECWEGSDCDPTMPCYVGRALIETPLTLEIPVTETCDFTDECGCEGETCTFQISDDVLPLASAEIVAFEYDGAVEGGTFVVE